VPGQCPAGSPTICRAAYSPLWMAAGRAPAARKPFSYVDKGSMATVSRLHAVARVGRVEFAGALAWIAWLALHLYYLVGHRNRLAAVISWSVAFLGRGRGQLAVTEQRVFARTAIEHLARAERQPGA
jgi:NADH dehydrogenase